MELETSGESETSKIAKLAKQFKMVGKWMVTNEGMVRTVLDKKELVEKVFEAMHGDLGHYGKDLTVKEIKARFLVVKDLLNYGLETLDSCIPCQLFKPDNNSPTTLHSFGTEYGPFEFWELDFVGPWIKTSNGNSYLLTAIDYSTSKAFAFPLPKRSGEAVVDCIDYLIWSYGPPKQILSDNGKEFISDIVSGICGKFGIKQRFITPGHPETNGKVERFNYELLRRIQRISQEPGHQLDHWDRYIRKALFAFHAHTNSRWKASSFYLQYGIAPRLPATSQIVNHLTVSSTPNDRLAELEKLQAHRAESAQFYRESIERLAANREQYLKETAIGRGDLVMRKRINVESKLHPRWDGPFVIVSSTPDGTYHLATANGYHIKAQANQA